MKVRYLKLSFQSIKHLGEEIREGKQLKIRLNRIRNHIGQEVWLNTMEIKRREINMVLKIIDL